MTTVISRSSTNTAEPTKATFSYWIKGAAKNDSAAQGIWGWHRGNDASNYWFGVYYSTNDSMYLNWKQAGSYGGIRGTQQKFRDPTAWSHHVIAIDSTLSSATDRIKWYFNGVRITDFEDSSYTLAQNATIKNWSNTQDKIEIGSFYQNNNALNLANHSLSHFHFTDGYAYQATDFGELDATTGSWKIKTAPTVSYGSQGFWILKDGNSLTDSSSNSNNFSVDSGTLTKTEDNPSNNFAVWNVNMNNAEDGDWNNGNTTIGPNGDDTYLYAPTTLGVSSGKWYTEHMITGGNGFGMMGAISEDDISNGFANNTGLGSVSNSFAFRCRDGNMRMNSTNTAYGSAPGTSSAILGMALDMDNKKVWYHINGTYVTYNGGVGDPAGGNYGWDFSGLSGNTFLITCGDDSSSGYGNFKSNFGNGYFGTTAVTSAGNNASGNGIFEYDVPTGFTALSTKGLNL